jgi:hypothetical protein
MKTTIIMFLVFCLSSCGRPGDGEILLRIAQAECHARGLSFTYEWGVVKEGWGGRWYGWVWECGTPLKNEGK